MAAENEDSGHSLEESSTEPVDSATKTNTKANTKTTTNSEAPPSNKELVSTNDTPTTTLVEKPTTSTEDNRSKTSKRSFTSNDDNTTEKTPPPKKPKREKGKPKPSKDPNIKKLRQIIQKACGQSNLQMALDAYDEMAVKQGIQMESQSFQNLINLCEGDLGERKKIHIGTPKNPGMGGEKKQKTPTQDAEIPSSKGKHYTLKERKHHAFQLKLVMDQNGIALNENAYTALVRLLCKMGDLHQAEDLLVSVEKGPQNPRVRIYACLIHAYCDKDDLAGAVRVWKKMMSIERISKKGITLMSLEPTEAEYCAMMKCATRVGDSDVMEYVLTRVGEDLLVPSLDTTNAIIDWFQSDFAIRFQEEEEGDSTRPERTDASRLLSELPLMDGISLGPVQYESSNKENIVIVSRDVGLKRSSGQLLSGCLKGKKLKPVPLTQKAWREMMEMNESIVLEGELKEHAKVSKFAGGKKGLKRPVTEKLLEKRKAEWTKFKDFLMETVGHSPIERSECVDDGSKMGKIDVVIDGANVGTFLYFVISFSLQVNISHLSACILKQGYYKNVFTDSPQSVDYEQIDSVVNHFRKQKRRVLLFLHDRHFSKSLLPKDALPIVKKWTEEKTLYRTPYEFNDDWFWMHAALWSGRDTLVVSNDEMRDHHFQMLAHKYFLRWKERHQVHFEKGRKGLTFHHPLVYSRRIQKLGDYGLVIPLPKRGDENRFLDGCHVADESTPKEERYVCINLQPKI